METRPDQINVPANNIGMLQSELAARGKRTQWKAFGYLLLAVFFLGLGGWGIYLAPDLVQRDRERLQSQTVKQALESNFKKIDSIDEELEKLRKFEDLEDIGDGPHFFGVDLAENGLTGVVVGTAVILTTKDAGSTWIRQGSDVKAILTDVAVSSSGQRSIAVGAQGVILITDDAGSTWTRRDSDAKTNLQAIALSSDGQTAMAVGGGSILTTKDAGNTWTKDSERGRTLQAIALSSDGQTAIAVGGDGAMLTTDDAGSTWARRDSSVKTNLLDVALSSDGQTGIAVGWDGAILTTDDAGSTWARRDSGVKTNLLDVALSSDGQTGIAVAEESILMTKDAGITWTKDSERGRILQAIALSSDGQAGVALGWTRSDPFKGTMLTTKDGGATWSNPQEVRARNQQKLLIDRHGLVQENRYLEIGLTNFPSDGSAPNISGRITANTWNYLTLTASWRLPILVLSLFLAQVLVGLNRYHKRLAAFYFARADALSLLGTENISDSLETFERTTLALSPHHVDFGRTPQTLPQQAMEIGRLAGRGLQKTSGT